jgi:hypothetical protein
VLYHLPWAGARHVHRRRERTAVALVRTGHCTEVYIRPF